MTQSARLFARVSRFHVVSLLAFVAPITSSEIRSHGCDEIIMVIVIQEVDPFRFERTRVHDPVSRVIFGPPVTTESRGRFESGFGYFEVFKQN